MEQAEKVLVNKPIYLDSFVSDKSDSGSMDAFSRSPLSKQSKNMVCERIGGKWHWTGYSSLTSSFPVSSPSWHLSPAYPLCQRTPEDQYTHSSLSLSLSSLSLLSHMTLYGFFIQHRLFCIPEVFRNAVFLVIYRALYSSPWISNRFARSFPLRSISFCIVIHRLYQMAVATRLSLSLILYLSFR